MIIAGVKENVPSAGLTMRKDAVKYRSNRGREFVLKRMGKLFIIFYQTSISPFLPLSCRFYPTCSQYTLEAIDRYGLMKGFYLGGKRILRCHPFHPGGYDPVK